MFCIKDKNGRFVLYHNNYINTLMKEYKNLERLSIVLNADMEETRKIVNSNTLTSYSTEQYNKWTKEEDEQLKEEYMNNLSIKEISKIHKRSYGAIKSITHSTILTTLFKIH